MLNFLKGRHFNQIFVRCIFTKVLLTISWHNIFVYKSIFKLDRNALLHMHNHGMCERMTNLNIHESCDFFICLYRLAR